MSDKFQPENMLSMLRYRMGWNVSSPPCQFREVRCYKLHAEMALIFIVHKETYFTVEDELSLFPSDALVTKLRLME